MFLKVPYPQKTEALEQDRYKKIGQGSGELEIWTKKSDSEVLIIIFDAGDKMVVAEFTGEE